MTYNTKPYDTFSSKIRHLTELGKRMTRQFFKISSSQFVNIFYKSSNQKLLKYFRHPIHQPIQFQIFQIVNQHFIVQLNPLLTTQIYELSIISGMLNLRNPLFPPAISSIQFNQLLFPQHQIMIYPSEIHLLLLLLLSFCAFVSLGMRKT